MVGEILSSKTRWASLISVDPRDKLGRAIVLMEEHHISQLPVVDDRDQVVGSINESSIMKALHDGLDVVNQEISAVMGKPLPTLDVQADASEAYRLLLAGAPGIIVTFGVEKRGIGVVTRSDLISLWVRRDGGKQAFEEIGHGI